MHQVLLTALCAFALQSADPRSMPAQLRGGLLLDGGGANLYTFEHDAMGESRCNAGCADEWLPLAASTRAEAACGFSKVRRLDGSLQWAFRDKPLYRYAGDRPGELLHDDRGASWHLARVGAAEEVR
jgi:predicted lipoprotein with Yx(FWY)xxD motif